MRPFGAVTTFALVLAIGPAGAEPARPIVLELFTSQGCSSCPPADALLRDIARNRADVLALAAVLTLAAIVGKQVCALAARGVDGVAVGIGMIPRGEVGLIFANLGLSLTVNGQRIIDEATFSAVVIMVIVTTLITPVALKWRLAR